MAFCKFSNGYLSYGFTSIDNSFITKYMPFAKDEYVKAYIYGLFLCSNNVSSKLENFSEETDLPIDTVKEAFEYWQEQGLVAIVSTSPFEVTYLPINDEPIKLYKKEKFADFNDSLQSLYPDREIPSGEYLKYYEFADDTKMQLDAIIMIVKYCINLKGTGVRYPYILTVAKDWAASGIKTVDDVEERIKEYETNSEDTRLIAKAIGKKSEVEPEDKELYIKWTKSWGFDIESILYAATFSKNKGGFPKLDKTLDNFYRLSIFTSDEMKAYKKNRDKLYELAKDITSRLGLYYESLDYIIETYISKWLNMGFDETALLEIADIAMKSNIRSYEGMHNRVLSFFKNGRLTKKAVDDYVATLIETDKMIKSVIETLGSSRLVNNTDRDYFNTWTNVWGFSVDAVKYVAELVSKHSQSFAYLNNTLGRLKEKNCFSLDDVKKTGIESDNVNAKKNKSDIQERSFTKEELSGLFVDIDDIDISEVF